MITEARKDDSDKARWDLVPPDAMEQLLFVFNLGARKYGDRNWEKHGGMKWGRIFAAMMRHAWAFWRGEQKDPVDGQYHLASVAWCALALLAYDMRGTGEDDRFRPEVES